MNAPLFRMSGVSFAHPGRQVLDGVDLHLHAGERVALVGGNGSGKTTLLHILVGLLTPSAGTLEAFGKPRRAEQDFHDVRSRAGLVFQDPDDQLFCPTVMEDVAFGPLNLGKTRDEAVVIAGKALADLGLDGFAERITHRLSGGEKRLVSLAAVMAMEPEVLLLDEPTNGLDAAAAERLTRLLCDLPQAMIFVSHDRRFVETLATRALHLENGRLAEAEVHAHPHVHVHSHLHVHAPGMADHSHDGETPPHEDHSHDGPGHAAEHGED